MFKQTYPRTLTSIDAIMRDVKAELERLKLPRKNLVHALLLTEECTAALIENVSQRSDEPVEVAVRKRFGDISVRITVAGEECDPTLEVPLGDGTDQQDRDVQAVLRNRILRAYDSDLSHSYKNNRNVVTLTVKKNARKTLWFTLAAFCAVTSLVATTGVGMLLSLVGVVGTFVLGLLILLVVYGLLILVLTRESPITFYRKYASCMLLAFTLSSSNATMPTTIQYCVNKLGVSPKVASFAIPLGSTINMDGSCVYLAVCSLFLAQMYGVDISGGTLLTLAISVMMLAIGAPGVTGAAFICLSTLVLQLGIPVESVTILMGIDQLLSMLRTTGNTAGDAVGAIVVAKTEGLFDEEMYRNKSL